MSSIGELNLLQVACPCIALYRQHELMELVSHSPLDKTVVEMTDGLFQPAHCPSETDLRVLHHASSPVLIAPTSGTRIVSS